jgi:hypothetical protein
VVRPGGQWEGRWYARAGEPGADLVGVQVVQVLEDDQGRSPGVAGSWQISSGVEGVAKVGEDDGLPVAVATELPVRGQGPPEAGDRVGVVPELMVRVAEAVPRQRLAVAVADGAVEVKGPLAVLDGALVVSQVRA